MKLSKNKIWYFFITMSLVLVSCDKEDDSQQEDPQVNFSAQNTLRAAQTDNVVEGTFTIMENAYDEEETRSSGPSLFTECTTIIFNPNGNGGGTITLDFGSSCTLNNGAEVSGMIVMDYGAIVDGSRTINYSFQNYTYNGNAVSGGGEIVRELENENGNPQSTINEEILVAFTGTDITATRNGLRIAEWTEGVGSGTWLDNVYEISGNWTTTLSNGFERSGTVVEPLVKKLNCLYLVEGILEVTQEGLTAQLDFGDGNCDNDAVFIFNGQEYPVEL